MVQGQVLHAFQLWLYLLGLKEVVGAALDSVSIDDIRKYYFRKACDYMHAYHEGKAGDDIYQSVKQYKSHRRVFDTNFGLNLWKYNLYSLVSNSKKTGPSPAEWVLHLCTLSGSELAMETFTTLIGI